MRKRDETSDRNKVIVDIKRALKRRSGRAWSVTGGKGTAYGWITIKSLPSERTANLDGTAPHEHPEFGYMTLADREQLAQLLGLERIHAQGESIPAGYNYYREYLRRANGQTPAEYGKQYWD